MPSKVCITTDVENEVASSSEGNRRSIWLWHCSVSCKPGRIAC